MKPSDLRLSYLVLYQKYHHLADEVAQEAFQVMEKQTRPEEARRTKLFDGNKYDESRMLGELRKVFKPEEIWTEKEACKKLGRSTKIFHLLTKMVTPGWIKKGVATDFADFKEQREKQGATGADGCRTFYKLIPNIYDIGSVSTEKLKA